jgi:hypothetical protein
MIIMMRATLHDRAPNTYYGQWPGKKPLLPGLEAPAIAHHELAPRAGFMTSDGPERDFPGNRSAPRRKFMCRPKRKNLRTRRRGAPATTTPLTASL